MEQHIPQDENRRTIIRDMVKKRDSVVLESTLTAIKEKGYYGLSLLSQFFYEQGRFLNAFMDFVCKDSISLLQEEFKHESNEYIYVVDAKKHFNHHNSIN